MLFVFFPILLHMFDTSRISWKGNSHRLEQYRGAHVVGVFSDGALATVCFLNRYVQHVSDIPVPRT